jgi:hypothetical protein
MRPSEMDSGTPPSISLLMASMPPSGILGVAVLMGPDAFGANAASLVGMLGGALSFGFSALWMRRLRHIPPP